MSKILFGTLIAWLVTSCSMEEPNDSGVLVDPNSEIDVPDWITPAYLDLNKDGTVDILDLVIHSKFFGQDVLDESSDTTSDSYKISLPEFIYARIELEQRGWYDREASKSVVIPEYGHNLQIAMRIQVQKKVTGDPLKDRFNFYDFPEIKIKIISNQQKPTQKEFTFNNRISSTNIHWRMQTEKDFDEVLSNLEYWADRGVCGLRRSSQSQTVGSDNYFEPSFFFQINYFNFLVSNIREVKQLENCESMIYERSPSSARAYGIMKDGLHIGKEIINKYTDTNIDWIRLILELDAADQNEKRNYTTYVFKAGSKPLVHGWSYKDEDMGTLLGQFMTPSIQQQIKEEHFPEDVN